jgi:hypothetical protein
MHRLRRLKQLLRRLLFILCPGNRPRDLRVPIHRLSRLPQTNRSLPLDFRRFLTGWNFLCQ